MPAGFWSPGRAFGLFRFFDAAKPGCPVAWADRAVQGRDGNASVPVMGAGPGIMLDDLVAALCTLLVIALWRWWA